MNEELYQNIFDEIALLLPEDWSRLIYRCFYTTGSWSMKYYVDCGNGTYVDCFKLPGAARAKILQAFQRIDRIVTPVRNQATDKDKWTAMTLQVDSEGKFHADFDYADLSESTVTYTMDWENKYLK